MRNRVAEHAGFLPEAGAHGRNETSGEDPFCTDARRILPLTGRRRIEVERRTAAIRLYFDGDDSRLAKPRGDAGREELGEKGRQTKLEIIGILARSSAAARPVRRADTNRMYESSRISGDTCQRSRRPDTHATVPLGCVRHSRYVANVHASDNGRVGREMRDLVVRYDPRHAGWVVVDSATQAIIGGPFAQVEYALGTAHSLATKNHVQVRPDAKYTHRGEGTRECERSEGVGGGGGS